MANIIIKLLSNITKQRLVVPVYHAVANNSPDHLKHLYKVRSEKEFIKDLDFLLKHYKPLSMQDLINRLESGASSEVNEFILTFDDGLREVFDVVRPILLSRGVSATIFLNTGFINNKEMFYRYKASLLVERLSNIGSSASLNKEMINILKNSSTDFESLKKEILSLGYEDIDKFKMLSEVLEVDFQHYLNNNQLYLSREQIESMIEDGFSFGAHSIDHPDYVKLSLEMQLKQSFKSVQNVKDWFGQKYGLFAFPFTDFGISKAYFDEMFACNKPKIHASFGTAGMKSDIFPQHLQRIPVENYSSSLSSTVIYVYLYYLLKVPFRKNKIKRS